MTVGELIAKLREEDPAAPVELDVASETGARCIRALRTVYPDTPDDPIVVLSDQIDGP